MSTPVVRKISDTIIDFGEPLIGQLDADQPLETVRRTFEIVIMVWNALAMPRWGQPLYFTDLQERLRDPLMPAPMVEAMQELSLIDDVALGRRKCRRL